MTAPIPLPRCHTLGCDFAGTVPGDFSWDYDGFTRSTRVIYCQRCGSAMWSDGSFTPDDADALHKAEQLTERQARTLARFETSPPAPESFDAISIVRAVAQVLGELEAHRQDVLDEAATEMDDTYGRGRGHGVAETIDAVRAALRGAW